MRAKTVVNENVTETREKVVSDVVSCDICGAESPERIDPVFDGWANWTNDPFAVARTTIARRTGYEFPESQHYYTDYYHVCPACWPKLAAWIASFRGAEPTREEVDW